MLMMGENSNLDIWLAGATAAFTIDLIVYPLDTIKTRWQSQDFAKTYATTAGHKKLPPNIFKGLYQGVGSVLLATLPAAGVFFTTYESAKSLYARGLPSGIPQPVVHAAASGTAELASCLVLTPAEVIKQNAQMIKGSGGSSGWSTSLQAWRMLQHSQGGPLRRLWRGYTALAARNLPHTAIQFPVFEFLRRKIWDWREKRQPKSRSGGSGAELLETWLVNGASAGASGALAAVLTTPTDVVKTRMMLMGESSLRGTAGGGPVVRGTPGQTERRPGGWDVAKQVLRERGVKGLFRGGALRAVWTAVGSGLYLGTYEVSKVWLRGTQVQRDDDI